MNCGVKIRVILLSLFLFMSKGAWLFSQSDAIEFEHLTLKDGLANLRVEAIVQDHLGYMWFGTKRGLCRYNGYEMDVFKSKAQDANSLKYHQISCLFEDRDHDLWIGSWSGGLHLFNRQTENFTRMPFATRSIKTISQDSEGFLWIGSDVSLHKYNKLLDKDHVFNFWSEDGKIERRVLSVTHFENDTYVSISGLGILKYNREENDFTTLLLMKECKAFGISEIFEIFPYNKQILWLGTDQGLYSFSLGDRKLSRVLDVSGKGIYNEITFIVNESYNKIWIGADGLYNYNIVTNTFQHSKHDINKPYSLSNDFVTCGLKDTQGNLWFGTYASGINVIKNVSVDFHQYSRINEKLDQFSRNITAISQDMKGNLLLGTWDKGLLVFDSNHQILNTYHRQYPELISLEKENIRVIERGPENGIWIGSSSALLTWINNEERQYEIFNLPVPEDQELNRCHITCLLFDTDNLLWIGTSTNGLFLFDMVEHRFLDFRDKEKISEFNILDLEKDWNGNIWIASYENGVFRMDRDQNIEEFYFEGIGDNNNKKLSYITLYLDSNDNLWFGTEFYGLIKLTKENETTIYPVSLELDNFEITDIIEDKSGKIWLSTTEGLLRFDESVETYRHYTWEDGLVSDEFNYNSSFIGDDQTIYMGGTNGLAYFEPHSIRENLTIPPIYIESLYLNNQEMKVGQEGSPLSKPLNQIEKIILKHSQNVIGFDFTALNYISTSKNQYAYMLEGFDESQWNELGTGRRMTFTNLDFGSYVLRVKGSNNDGVWNEEGASIAIQILPPLWRTWWAYLIYVVILLLIVRFLFRVLSQQFRMRQQIKMQRFEKEQQEKLSDMKLQFFTNISHEFKIPLSLIISPLEEIIKKYKGSSETRQNLMMVNRNATRLLQLVKLLIDFRKAEQDVLALNPGQHELVSLAKEVIDSFKPITTEENKHIELLTEYTSLVFEFDRNKMERVLYNLIANAINFTRNLGEIIISISYEEEGQSISIEVRDTGIGIRAEDQDKIFEKFSQIEQESGSKAFRTGSGIGLYLSKKIVELHHGRIEVKSVPGEGSCFTISLPAPDARINELFITTFSEEIPSQGLEMLEVLEKQDAPVHSEDVPLILIVEDHGELRNHLKKILWTYYRVEEASNGKAGIEKAKDLHPDLILSDIIMPEMDGVEMCKQIKRDPKTEDIPIILLSAKSDLESKIDGYEKGADDYLEKPFLPQFLLVRVRNLIESREKLRTHFSSGTNQKQKIPGLNPLDREFLEKIFYKLEQNMDNSEFNITQLSSELGMSRVHLYRRFKDLTGITPKDYMKETRLKAAAVLLEENRYTVSEVAYRVGFNTPSNFTASFKSFYGISPKEYKSS